MESRLKGQIDSPVFENLVDLLKTKAWPEETFENFGDMKLQILGDHFWEIILKRNCEINFINAERQVLISFLLPFIKDYKPAILLKVTLIHGYFSRFLNCTNGTKSSRKTSQLYSAQINLMVIDKHVPLSQTKFTRPPAPP